jgi:short-subunit dehydrogenase
LSVSPSILRGKNQQREDAAMLAEQYGPWALIAGGSEGVGESFALKLAAQGVNLVLVARKSGPLESLADRVRGAGSVQVRSLAQDLTAPDMLDRIKSVTHDIDVGLLIYNAGSVSGFSSFLDVPMDDQMRMVRLGVVAPTALAYHFGAGMRARGRGGIILIGSMAGYAGAPDEIVYSAGKAYSRMLAEGLWYELKPHNVHVLGLILGLTRTPAMDRLGLKMNNPEFPPDEPDAVVEEGFAHLAHGPIWNVGGKEEGARYLSTIPRAQAVEFMAKGAKDLHG